MKNIVFGLNGTLCDIESLYNVNIRPGASELLKVLKEQGHEITIWTFKKRKEYDVIKKSITNLTQYFDDVICFEDKESRVDIPGCSLHFFKDIRKLKNSNSILIDSVSEYQRYSKNLHIDSNYYTIDKYKEIFYKYPSSWKIKILGQEAIDKYYDRINKKEEWAYKVLEFVNSKK